MKRTTLRLIATVFIAGLVMMLPHNPCCEQPEERITVFYTHDLQGTLAPCG